MNFSKNLFSLKYIVAAKLDEQSNNFQRQFIFMYIQINDMETSERCIRKATCKRKFGIN